ncbi:MAG TPA: hypothetical protein VGG12_02180 [Methylovirgula sp.]|jgi:hypothetical protein
MRSAGSWAKLIAPAFFFASLFCAEAAQAQGTNIGKPLLFGDGIACDAALLPWSSVWFGHFSGGLATYRRGDPTINLAWEDRKLCFPSKRECMAWQRWERRQYNEVEGYWTCLPLR